MAINKKLFLILLLIIVIAITSCSQSKLIGEEINSIKTITGVGINKELINEGNLLYETEEEGSGGGINPYFLIRNTTGVEILKVSHTGAITMNGSVLLDDNINITGNVTSVDCIIFANGGKVGNCG